MARVTARRAAPRAGRWWPAACLPSVAGPAAACWRRCRHRS